MSLYKNQIYEDSRGKLIVFESMKNIPFEIKRVFSISDVKETESRGDHAHHCIKQFLVVLKGSCKIIFDDGVSKNTYFLDNSNVGLYQDAMVWGTMSEFSRDCILLVFASDYYDQNDYINNYEEFMSLKKSIR